jgi:hypothetical protein
MNKKSNKNTVLCKYFQTNSCDNYNCKFAHTIDDLLPRLCCYGKKCNFDRRNKFFNYDRRPCCYFHPGEIITKDELYKRAIEYNEINVNIYSCNFDRIVISVFNYLNL